jgi:hypothetical protein
LEQDKNPLSRVLQLILLIFHSIQKAAKASGLVCSLSMSQLIHLEN